MLALTLMLLAAGGVALATAGSAPRGWLAFLLCAFLAGAVLRAPYAGED